MNYIDDVIDEVEYEIFYIIILDVNVGHISLMIYKGNCGAIDVDDI